MPRLAALRALGRATIGVTGIGGIAAVGSSMLECEGEAAATLYSQGVMPAIRLVDAELAHRVAILASKYKVTPRQRAPDPDVLKTALWGKEVDNPIGLAAGFDKDGEAMAGLMGVGFGLVEVGSVTPKPQPGNPKPRVFRLPEDGAVINRYGFNSCGHAAAAENLAGFRNFRDSSKEFSGRFLGVNLGKNKTSEDAAADYAAGVRELAQYADYLVVNVSSPNTPGLRALQEREQLRSLLRAVRKEMNALPKSTRRTTPLPLVLKVAPDLSDSQRADIAAVVLDERIDGLIVSNTTISREGLKGAAKGEAGGLSGKPLFEASTAVLADFYKRTKGKVTLIGAGGVSSGADAYAKIKAGASVVQLYTALAYDGPPLVPKIKRELAELLKADGYKSVKDAVGADTKKKSSWF